MQRATASPSSRSTGVCSGQGQVVGKTKALLSAVPVPDPAVVRPPVEIRGSVSVPVDPPPRCRFYDRCPIADDFCRDNDHPPLEDKGGGRVAACYKA